jgi:signal transduction histidine kinase
VVAFAYILIVLVVALGVPLSVNLERRVTAEMETNALVLAQAVAGVIGPEEVERASDTLPERGVTEVTGPLRGLRTLVANATHGVRVVVVDAGGRLLADTAGVYPPGDVFANGFRPEIGQALAGDPTSTVRHSDTLGHDLMATAVPVYDETGRIVGAVRITQDVQAVSDSIVRTRLGLVAIGTAALLAGLVLAFALAGSLSRPLTRLASAARALGSGDLSARAGDVRGATEFEELAGAFDEMAGRLERTVRAQREFVANASHQLRTPLTGMKLRIEGAIAESDDPAVSEQLVAADHEVDRLSATVDRLLSVSRDVEEGRPGTVDLGAAVERAVARWSERATRAGSTIVRSENGAAAARANEHDVDQVLDNLIENAISYAPGSLEIESGVRGAEAFVAVADRGPGIPSDERDRVTERFYRGRGAPSGGSGLGLSIAASHAERWGGSLDVMPREAGGTRIEVRLPLADGFTGPYPGRS